MYIEDTHVLNSIILQVVSVYSIGQSCRV